VGLINWTGNTTGNTYLLAKDLGTCRLVSKIDFAMDPGCSLHSTSYWYVAGPEYGYPKINLPMIPLNNK